MIGGSNNIVERNSVRSFADASYMPPPPLSPDDILAGNLPLPTDFMTIAFMEADGPVGAGIGAAATAAVPDLSV